MAEYINSRADNTKHCEDNKTTDKEARDNLIPIENEIYYHLTFQDRPIGSIFECKTDKKDWEVPDDLLNTERKFYDFCKNKDNEELISIKRYKDCYKKFRGYIRAVREYILEETRKNYFPSMPSRASVFVFKNLDRDTFNFWYDELNRPDYLLKLQLNGKIFRTTEEHLLLDTFSINILRENAISYWKGAPGSNPAHDEYIFVGKCKVLENHTAKSVFIRLNGS